jgi:CheY-like chemotaxis protein
MDIACEHCQAKFKIPDGKVPKGQSFSLACPKCKKKITVDGRPAKTDPPAPAQPAAKKNLVEEVSSESYDADSRPFDFVEEGVETALICEPDPEYRNKIRTALKALKYHTTEAASGREVLKHMRFHIFDMVVINETFDSPDPDQNNILRYLERLPMATRRNMFVALLSERFRTMDNMSAFVKSVNVVINLESLDDFDKILNRAVKDNIAFYKIYKEAMIRAGKT